MFLQNLKKIGGGLIIRDNTFKEISFPNLKNIEDSIIFENEEEEIVEVGLFISNNNELETVSFNSLEKVKVIAFVSLTGDEQTNLKLKEINLENLKKCERLLIIGNPELSNLNLNNLEKIKVDIPESELLKDNEIFFNISDTKLKKITLNNLVNVDSINIENNDELETINFNKLNEIKGDLEITNNKKLINLTDIFPDLEYVNGKIKDNEVTILIERDDVEKNEGLNITDSFKKIKEIVGNVDILNVTPDTKKYFDREIKSFITGKLSITVFTR